MRRLPVAALLMPLGLTAGCATADGEGEPMRTASRDQVAIEVHDRAVAVAEQAGVPLRNPTLGPVPCEGPGGGRAGARAFAMSGTHQLMVGRDRLPEVLRQLHARFAADGFGVNELEWLPDGTGKLRGTDRSGYTYSLTPTTSRSNLAFFVDSPCFRAPEGEDPTDPFWAPPPEVTWNATPSR